MTFVLADMSLTDMYGDIMYMQLYSANDVPYCCISCYWCETYEMIFIIK